MEGDKAQNVSVQSVVYTTALCSVVCLGCSKMDLLHLLCIFALPVFCIVNVKNSFVFFQRSVQGL